MNAEKIAEGFVETSVEAAVFLLGARMCRNETEKAVRMKAYKLLLTINARRLLMLCGKYPKTEDDYKAECLKDTDEVDKLLSLLPK